MQCIGQNYAYNEMSYFLVRLLQQFDGFSLAPEVQPAASLPPADWKGRKGRQAYERIWPAAALTLYVKVRSPHSGRVCSRADILARRRGVYGCGIIELPTIDGGCWPDYIDAGCILTNTPSEKPLVVGMYYGGFNFAPPSFSSVGSRYLHAHLY